MIVSIEYRLHPRHNDMGACGCQDLSMERRGVEEVYRSSLKPRSNVLEEQLGSD